MFVHDTIFLPFSHFVEYKRISDTVRTLQWMQQLRVGQFDIWGRIFFPLCDMRRCTQSVAFARVQTRVFREWNGINTNADNSRMDFFLHFFMGMNDMVYGTTATFVLELLLFYIHKCDAFIVSVSQEMRRRRVYIIFSLITYGCVCVHCAWCMVCRLKSPNGKNHRNLFTWRRKGKILCCWANFCYLFSVFRRLVDIWIMTCRQTQQPLPLSLPLRRI